MGGMDSRTMRNGRPDQWAESVVCPRTAGRHAAVHKRLVLALAISVLTLVTVTAVAAVLVVRSQECGELGGGGPRVQPGRGNGSRGERGGEEEEGSIQPWRKSRLPTNLLPRHYDLRLSVDMDNFTFSGEVSIQLECVNATKFIVLHAERLKVLVSGSLSHPPHSPSPPHHLVPLTSTSQPSTPPGSTHIHLTAIHTTWFHSHPPHSPNPTLHTTWFHSHPPHSPPHHLVPLTSTSQP